MLTLIAEPFPDWEADAHSAGARDLIAALAVTAPRSCSARYLVAKGSPDPGFSSPLIRTEHLPLRSTVLPLLWQNGATARPLTGEFVHAMTPMVPLRSHTDDDGTQTSVTITNTLAWDAPTMIGASQARLYRAFVRRAVKHADVLFTPTHATARVLHAQFGEDLPIQVLHLAAPAEYLSPDDAIERRIALGIPNHYAITTAPAGEEGRLKWIVDALRADLALPPVVVLEGLDPVVTPIPQSSIPAELQHRLIIVTPRELSDVGAALSGASLLLQPQSYVGTGYTLLAALSGAVPVLHSGHPAAEELALDAGLSAPSADAFAAEFSRLFREPNSLAPMAVLARDRSRGFDWRSTAWQIWEAHANM